MFRLELGRPCSFIRRAEHILVPTIQASSSVLPLTPQESAQIGHQIRSNGWVMGVIGNLRRRAVGQYQFELPRVRLGELKFSGATWSARRSAEDLSCLVSGLKWLFSIARRAHSQQIAPQRQHTLRKQNNTAKKYLDLSHHKALLYVSLQWLCKFYVPALNKPYSMCHHLLFITRGTEGLFHLVSSMWEPNNESIDGFGIHANKECISLHHRHKKGICETLPESTPRDNDVGLVGLGILYFVWAAGAPPAPIAARKR